MNLNNYQYLIQHLRHFFEEYSITDEKFVVAVSGGKDSIMLLHLCSQITKTFVAIYVNHQTRPECQQEALFIQETCQQLEVFFQELKIEPLDLNMSNFEAIAREKRYQILNEYASFHDISHVLTAHHRDDVIETVLLKCFRGSTNMFIPQNRSLIRGSCVQLLRPLLDISQEEIQNYLNIHQITYLQDSSNSNQRYLRNFVRETVIPLLKNKIPQFSQKILTLSSQKLLEEDFITKYTQNKIQEIFSGTSCSVELFQKEHPVIQQRILQYKCFFFFQKTLTGKELKNIINQIKAKTATILFIENEKYQFVKEYNTLRFFLKNNVKNLEKKHFIMHNKEIQNFLLNWEISLQKGKGLVYLDKDIIYLRSIADEDKIVWNTGTKAIVDVLKDHKVSRFVRSLAQIIIKNDKIVGVLCDDFVHIIKSERALSNQIGIYITKRL